ncbi:YfbU family protein [Pseudomonas sp. GM30]|uniref:YfbU family protein n=1 Tax=Pseudomonas sp. GM30 TaxID=1144328 RepID=UPI0005EB78C2|nr:YfbU family protein [Pseudomonas sp. GM30]
MEFSGKDQLLFTLLTDIHKALNIKDSIDADFIQRMICAGEGWALAHAYPTMFLREETPPNVKYVMDVLDLWQLLELRYADLTEAERAELDLSAGDVIFPGFDGNNESELLSIAHVLTEDLGKWAHFKGRIKNSHMPTTDLYGRMLEELEKQREPYSFELTLDQFKAVVRSRIHPDNR